MNGGEETPAINTGMVGTAEVSVDIANREVAVTLNVFNTPDADHGRPHPRRACRDRGSRGAQFPRRRRRPHR